MLHFVHKFERENKYCVDIPLSSIFKQEYHRINLNVCLLENINIRYNKYDLQQLISI